MRRARAPSAALAAVALATLAACARTTPPVASAPSPGVPLHVRPAVDLLPAAGLVWLVAVRPKAIALRAELMPALQVVLPQERLDTFAARHGGVDMRRLDEAVIAGYGDSQLFVGAGPVVPDAVERAFKARVVNVDGRGLDRAKTDDGHDREPITRMWGGSAPEREQLAIFGRDGIALEMGRFGVLRAVEAFAQERLKRAAPALRGAGLARAVAALGSESAEAPLRAFAPGPFTGAWAKGFGGLLASSTGAAASLDVVPGAAPAGSARLRLKLVLLDPKNDRQDEASERMVAAYDLLAQSDLGRLCGLDRPLAKPAVTYDASGALTLVTELDALALARGVHAATGARAEEFMSY